MSIAEQVPAGRARPATLRKSSWIVLNWGLLVAIAALVAVLSRSSSG